MTTAPVTTAGAAASLSDSKSSEVTAASAHDWSSQRKRSRAVEARAGRLVRLAWDTTSGM